VTRLLVILIFVALGNVSLAQGYGQHIDSLLHLAQQADDDRADTLYMEVGRALAYIKPVEAIPFLRTALDFAESTHDYKVQCMCHSFTGIAYYRLGIYAKAVEYYNNQLNVAKKHGMLDEVAWANNNIGQVLLENKNFEIANIYLQEAYETAMLLNDDYMLQFVYSNLGGIRASTQEYEESLDYLRKSLAIRQKFPTDTINLAVGYRDLGRVYYALNNYDKAKYYYGVCLQCSENINSSLGVPVLVNLSNIYLVEGKLDSALYCIRKSIVKSKTIGESANLRDAYGIYGQIYYSMGQYGNAEKCFSLQIAYHDSVKLSDVSKKIYELQFHKRIEDQQMERATAESRTRTIVYLCVVIVVLLVVAGIFLLRLRKKRRTIESINRQLADHNMQTIDSISYAKRIQKAVMPNFDSIGEGFVDKFLFFRPKQAVSGNYYWTHKCNGLEMYCVCDTGETGVPGGCFSMLGASTLHEVAEQFSDPAIILDNFRQRLRAVMGVNNPKQKPKDNSDISLVVTDYARCRIYFSGVKFPLVIVRDGKTILLQDNKETDNFFGKEFVTSEFSLRNGDHVYMMTHGVSRQMNAEGEELSRERLYMYLARISRENIGAQAKMLDNLINKWRGNVPQQRDLLLSGGVFNFCDKECTDI